MVPMVLSVYIKANAFPEFSSRFLGMSHWRHLVMGPVVASRESRKIQNLVKEMVSTCWLSQGRLIAQDRIHSPYKQNQERKE